MSFLDAETDDDTSIASDGSDGNIQNGRALIDDEAEESDNDYSPDARNGRVLIDDEAEESDNDYSSEVSDSLDEGHAAHVAFPQFMQLPPELRHRIWQFYCPDLTAKARVLQFTLSPSSAMMERPDHHSVKDHATLADQTEKLRAMLSTHRESRSIVVQKFPQELGMDAGSGDAIVRFRKETDVIILQGLKAGKDYFLPDFSKEIQNIAVNPWELFFGGMLNGPVDEAIPAMKGIFRNLRRLYVHTPAESQTAGQIRWCVTDYVHAYMVETYEKEPGLGEDTQSLFCWPDVDGHPDFAKYSIPKLFSRGKDVEVGVEMWPMVEFELEEGISQYNVLRLLKDVPDLDDDDDDDDDDGSGYSEVEYGDRHDDDGSEEGTDWDVYESEGIDDDDILESGGSSEDEVVPGDAGRFSSPESDHVQLVGEGDACAPVQRSRKRKAIVVDSDDDEEEEEDGEPRTKRARQPRVVLDSDDDDEGGRHADESEVEVVSTRRVERPTRTVSVSDDEDGADPGSDSREEEEDEDDVDSEDDEDEDEDGLLDTMAGEGTGDEDDEGDEDDGW
ncbi:hypothetical protein C2857_007553 [Epichloe festucae Fl1]|uniref:2EXR domain-containing protein n=1 Tax=Epichloe festucae (strain Fl1) TaxID=877507 RepID=A0A7S9KQU8_EPIFF|nr:hypothetical protein C2857_007553 [Epichloe festucae Fl1]